MDPAFWLVVALAAALRLLRLGAQCFWVDEIASIEAGKTSLHHMIGWYYIDPHPPLFYTLMKAWLLLGESEWTLRLLPALAGIGTVAVTWMIGRRLCGRTAATLGALLLAINPLAIWVSQELRSMALLGLFSTLSLYLLIRTFDQGGRRLRWSFILVTILMCYTHYYALFVLAFEVFWVVAFGKRAADGIRRSITSLLWIGLAALPWLSFFRMQIAHHGQSFRTQKSVVEIGRHLYYYFTTFHSPWRLETFFPFLDELYRNQTAHFHAVVSALLLPFAVLLVLGAIRTLRRGNPAVFLAAFAAVQLALVLFASRFVNLFEPKYMIAALPVSCLLTGLGLEWTLSKSRPLAAALAAWMLILTSVALYHHYFDARYHRPDWKSFVSGASEKLAESDAVLIYYRPTLSDFLNYYTGGAPVIAILPDQTSGAPLIEDAAIVEDALNGMGERRSVWFFDGTFFLHDPHRFATRVLEKEWVQTETFAVRESIGYVFRRYVPKPDASTR